MEDGAVTATNGTVIIEMQRLDADLDNFFKQVNISFSQCFPLSINL